MGSSLTLERGDSTIIKFTVPGEPVEIWKDVIGHEDEYEVSNLGRVRSKDRVQQRSNGFVKCDFRIRGQLLKPYFTGKGEGYCTVSINGKNKKVHRLVAEAFIPKTDENENEVNHKDGNKRNNTVMNLEWVTQTENEHHALKMGLKRSCEYAPNAKLSNYDVQLVRKLYKKGDAKFGSKPLARMFGVSDTTIRNIIKRKKWRFLSDY